MEYKDKIIDKQVGRNSDLLAQSIAAFQTKEERYPHIRILVSIIEQAHPEWNQAPSKDRQVGNLVFKMSRGMLDVEEVSEIVRLRDAERGWGPADENEDGQGRDGRRSRRDRGRRGSSERDAAKADASTEAATDESAKGAPDEAAAAVAATTAVVEGQDASAETPTEEVAVDAAGSEGSDAAEPAKQGELNLAAEAKAASEATEATPATDTADAVDAPSDGDASEEPAKKE